MSEKMLKFTKLGQQNPPKREVLERKEDFKEIYNEFINQKKHSLLANSKNVSYNSNQINTNIEKDINLNLVSKGYFDTAVQEITSINKYLFFDI